MDHVCYKKEQQQDGKNNAELLSRWANTTWATFEQTIRRGLNSSINAWLVTADDDLQCTRSTSVHLHSTS